MISKRQKLKTKAADFRPRSRSIETICNSRPQRRRKPKNRFPVVICDFHPLHLSNPVPQQQLLDYMSWLMATGKCIKNKVSSKAEIDDIHAQLKAVVHRFGASPSYISRREVQASAEACHENQAKKAMTSFPIFHQDIRQDVNGKNLKTRMEYFDDCVMQVLTRWYKNESFDIPDEIIHATCTGYLSPSPVQKFLSGKKQLLRIAVTHSYHMGCYGAIPPLKMAVGFLAASQFSLAKAINKIDVLHTEICSIHFDLSSFTPADIVNMSLFGDGFIKYSVYPESIATGKTIHGLKPLAIQDLLIENSTAAMSWIPGPFNFQMHLGVTVPDLIKNNICSYVESICSQIGLSFASEKNEMVFAIHPGGPRIIDQVRDQLGIEEEQIAHSRKVLFDLGNMSSATLPYIWQKITEDEGISPGTKILSIAFGPGLTAAGVIFEKT